MMHMPILRAGKPYRSVSTTTLPHVKTGEPVVEVSQANGGLISRDLLQSGANRQALAKRPVRELLEICNKAGELFARGTLPVDPIDGVMQSPEDYLASLSATTGMPRKLCQLNMDKISFVLMNMETVMGGLTRGLELDVLDAGWARQDDRLVSYIVEADSLGVVLPSNSPGVHSLWLPSIPLKVPLALKSGRQEPWSPFRILQAFLAAGCPPEALSFYPTDHGGAGTLMMRTDRSMIFGDANSVKAYVNDPRVQIHGPGWSKVIYGEDIVDQWRDYLDVTVQSIAENGGRSCLNASAVFTPRHGREIAEAIAERLGAIEAHPLDHPDSGIAAFSDPRIAHAINGMIEQQLKQPGAEDLTAQHRDSRIVEVDGCTYLLPTLVWCDTPEHPLAKAEFLFPYAAVCEVPQSEVFEAIGTTLVGTVITEDRNFEIEAMTARHIDRLNLGAFPTSRVSWDQPHEGNLFEHLYRQRAFQSPQSAASA